MTMHPRFRRPLLPLAVASSRARLPLAVVALACASVFLLACTSAARAQHTGQAQHTDQSPAKKESAVSISPPGAPTSYVNPMIGTGGHGHTYPGATVPYGMVQLSPDNGRGGWDWCSGYHASDTGLVGFSHTHLSGTGCADLGDILFMPTTHFRSTDRAYRSPFSHAREVATPGYYRVDLLDHDIRVELTATARTGMHRYTFARTDSARVLIDLRYGQDDNAIDCGFRMVDDTTLEGWRTSNGWAARQRIFFRAVFSRPIRALRTIADGAWTDAREVRGKNLLLLVDFGGMEGELLARVGISAVDADGARKNLEAEAPAFAFDALRAAAAAAWDEALGHFRIEAPDSTRRVFMTALYHTMLAPTLYQDVDGRYRGGDDAVHTARDFAHYSTFSLWDTFRALHPLATITDTRRAADWVNSMLAYQRETGLLPVWTLQANETNCMIGYHAVPVIADALRKGIAGIDGAAALAAMEASAGAMSRGLQFYNATTPVPFTETPDADWKKSLARARASYSGAQTFVSGFASKVSGQTLGYHSSHPKANEALLARATDGTMAISWRTAPAPARIRGEAVTFVWLAGMATAKGAHAFDLAIDGRRVLTLHTAEHSAQRFREFRGEGGVRLVFRATYADSWGDLFGTMALTVPARMLRAGSPLTLTLTGENGGSSDWVMTFTYAFSPALTVRPDHQLVLEKGATRQVLRVGIEHLGAPRQITCEIGTARTIGVVEPGMNTLALTMPPVTRDTMVDVRITLEGAPPRTERVAVAPVRALGWIPADKENESVSKTLEYAYDDWCIAETARMLGRDDVARRFDARAQFYRNVYEPGLGFMRGRALDGSWTEPFNARFSTLKQHEYTEGNAWQYTWFVPHDVEGLMNLMGGREGFAAKLDSLFTQDSNLENTGATGDVTGLIGMYAHGNEPSHHIAYLYAWAGQPYKTQALVRKIMREFYHDAPDGLIGNEDCGQMSAWYVFSACGLYPVNPASGIYVIGSPALARAEIRTAAGTTFTVVAENQGDENVYVQSAELNGVALDHCWLTHAEVMRGGTLVLRMGADPNHGWALHGHLPMNDRDAHR